MSQYKVNHQCEMIVLPREAVKLDWSGTLHRVYIKVRDVETLDNIIEQCKNIKEMFEENEEM